MGQERTSDLDTHYNMDINIEEVLSRFIAMNPHRIIVGRTNFIKWAKSGHGQANFFHVREHMNIFVNPPQSSLVTPLC